jgi:copper chaperone CopZ
VWHERALTKSPTWRRQLAAIKGKRSSKKSARQFTYFREVKGKIVENVEIDPDLNAITVLFQDKTALSFDLEPRLTVFPELSDWKTGNWRGIKRWRAIHSKISMVSWP